MPERELYCDVVAAFVNCVRKIGARVGSGTKAVVPFVPLRLGKAAEAEAAIAACADFVADAMAEYTAELSVSFWR